MPIPYRDQEDLESLGTAAFLYLEAALAPPGYRGALFQINARGEPVEFTYNRVETPTTFLWRPADIRRAALRRLTVSLFALCPRVPRLLFCRADQTPAELLTQDLVLDLPVCRIAGHQDLAPDQQPMAEVVAGDEPLHLFWYPSPPASETAERALVDRLIVSGLLLEPFIRAEAGLAELYGAAEPDRA